MRQLTVRLFGGLEVRDGSAPPLRFPTHRTRSLFGFLALHQGRFFPRDVICGNLWPRSSNAVARKGLRTALWRLRRIFESIPFDPDQIVMADGQTVGMPDTDVVWIDLKAFQHWTRPALAPGRDQEVPYPEHLECAIQLYRGDLMEGVYDGWCDDERQRLRLQFLDVLEGSMVHHARQREWRKAIVRGNELLRHDPFREHVHRELMRCHWAMGNRPAAIRQFRACAQLLREELDIDPMAETCALFEGIRRASGFPGDEATAGPSAFRDPAPRSRRRTVG